MNSNNNISQFGFSLERGGTHSARTMMMDELTSLLSYVEDEQASKDEYLEAIVEDNCLGKRSSKTRILSARHLANLYALDPNIIIFKALLYFWNRDDLGRPILALLCTIVRDNIFRDSLSFILSYTEGQRVSREKLEQFIDNLEPDRFSKTTLKSTAQNINATWTKSGHLSGRVKKIRTMVRPTPGVVAFALLLGYLEGVRGELLFEADYIKILDCSTEKAIELAQEASTSGWIIFKHVGRVIEVLFPNILTAEDMELIRE